jgi:hypothetical protein
MEDLIFTTLVLVVGGLTHAAIVRRQPAEARLLTISFAAHLFSAVAQILLYQYYYEGGGDVVAYYRWGVPISSALRDDFWRLFPLTVDVFFHQESQLPFGVAGAGSTGTMSMAAVWLLYLLGDSYVAVTLLIATLSYLAKLLIYRALRAEFPPEMHRTILVASMLVPSAVFWTSALLKEPVMMVFFGPLFLALRWFLEGRRLLLATAISLIAGTVVWLLKPYVLLSLAVAGSLWIIWQRVLRRGGSVVVKPVYLVLGLALGVGAFTGAGRWLPQVEGRSLTSAMTDQRHVSATVAGGSNYYLEEEGITTSPPEAEAALGQQLALAPLALVTALFRPFIFEARNAVQAINSIETAWVLFAFVQILRRQSLRTIVSRVTASPTLMFCLAFTVVLALGTGLSTSNLGTLSRYRAPMMPFFVLALLILRKPALASPPGRDDAVPSFQASGRASRTT